MYRLLFLIFLLNAFALAASAVLHWADATWPLDLSKSQDLSWQVVDKDQKPLRFFLSADDKIRLPPPSNWPEQAQNTPYLKLLLRYEDQHFFAHHGIAWPSLGRAVWQRLRYGRVISGGSTLTMQTARLLMPMPRSLVGKGQQMFRAWQLERRLSKNEILRLYLTLAPLGGNIEGISAASFRYFGKAATQLNLAEAALLVALPQAPEKYRPDRFPRAAETARNKVLARARGLFPAQDLAEASHYPLPAAFTAWPQQAPHLTFRLYQQRYQQHLGIVWSERRIYSCIDSAWQQLLAEKAQAAQAHLGEKNSLALILIDNKQSLGRAYLGSSDFFSVQRQGQVDMAQALRSPGSTLKPFIYALAMDRQFLHSETLLEDRPMAFGGYRPENFSKTFQGRISARQALQQSLNVPAVHILSRLGSENFWQWLNATGIPMALPAGSQANLSLALGGFGLSLEGLTSLYPAFANAGRWQPLTWLCPPPSQTRQIIEKKHLFSAEAANSIWEILRDNPPPPGFPPEALAFKTGTSYGFRDAWTVLWDEHLTLGLWLGRADASSNPGFFGRNSAAVLAFDFFHALPQRPSSQRSRPAQSAKAPKGLQYFQAPSMSILEKNPLQIIFPKDGSQLTLGEGLFILEASGGKRPLRWFVNGAALPTRLRDRRAFWSAEAGFYTITVVDANGKQQSVFVQLIENKLFSLKNQ